MIDLHDQQTICRSLGYFLDFLVMFVPPVALAFTAWRIAR
jgi:hypothetical protein